MQIEHIDIFERRPDREARRQLVDIYRHLAFDLANRYDGRGEDREDLVQVAMVGLVNAIDRFEPKYGVPFVSYAVPTILGEIRRHFRDRGWALRVPRGLKDRFLETRQASEDLHRQLGRPPTIEEVSNAVGLSVEEVVEASAVSAAYRPESIDEGESSESRGTMFGQDDANIDLMLEMADIEPVLAARSERDRQILYLRFYEDMTQREIAALVGMSQMNVSRILKSALEGMRAELTL
ncbi:MAG TPA: SigB/SigF/SigG family RNA polymerase sigma factor [Acidimicrobiia bacterium]|nr:SigB/SigF/SigG family RNA polymerase sigma factor [Acidimicrobiia bacterium]